MFMLQLLLSSLFGWIIGHLFATLNRSSGWLRYCNYPIGIAGAALGTSLSQSLPNLSNKFLLSSVVISTLSLLLFQGLRRVIGVVPENKVSLRQRTVI